MKKALILLVLGLTLIICACATPVAKQKIPPPPQAQVQPNPNFLELEGEGGLHILITPEDFKTMTKEQLEGLASFMAIVVPKIRGMSEDDARRLAEMFIPQFIVK
jgi:hypothetical protein